MTASGRHDSITGTLAVGVVTALLTIVALALAVGAMFMIGWMGHEILNVRAPDNALPFLVLVLAIDGACFACALGLPNGKSWAWTGSVVLAVVALGAFLFSHLPGSAGLIGLGVAFGALVALFLPQTRLRFGR